MKTLNPKTDGVTAEFHDLNEDEMATRLVEADGRKFNLIQDAHFNLWTIKPSKGPVPGYLAGQYTSVSEAEKAIARYQGAIKR